MPLTALTASLALAPVDQAAGISATPNAVVLSTDMFTCVNAVDGSGRELTDVEWALSAPIAKLTVDKGRACLQGGTHSGRAVLTGASGGNTATVTVTVLPGHKLPRYAVRWSLDPTPGYETLEARQAEPLGEVGLYSIEWSELAGTVVRALRFSGEQLWSRHLVLKSSPKTLTERRSPSDGTTFVGGERAANIGQVLLGERDVAFTVTPSNQIQNQRVPVGQEILIRDSGDGFGGLLLFERGHSSDSLVDLSPEDGREVWRFKSDGWLTETWTVNSSGDIGIVETRLDPPGSAFLVISGKTGKVLHRIEFPKSSSTITGFKCIAGNNMKNVRASRSGSVFSDGDNMYLQVEVHNETAFHDKTLASSGAPTAENAKAGQPACDVTSYSFENSLWLLRVSADGEPEWRKFVDLHADGEGPFVVQPRVFAGETIPDGLGGVLAAWSYFPADPKRPTTEARLSRLGPNVHEDYTLPINGWGVNPLKVFDANMVLGEDNTLFAVNDHELVSFRIVSGEVKWLRQAPTGKIQLEWAAAGGGVLLANDGREVYFDADGKGAASPEVPGIKKPGDIGFPQFDLFDQTPTAPLWLRDFQLHLAGVFLCVEDGKPNGRGALVDLSVD